MVAKQKHKPKHQILKLLRRRTRLVSDKVVDAWLPRRKRDALEGVHEELLAGDRVGSSVAAVLLDALDRPGLLLRREELGAVGEVDNDEPRDDAEADRDDTEQEEDPAEGGRSARGESARRFGPTRLERREERRTAIPRGHGRRPCATCPSR